MVLLPQKTRVSKLQMFLHCVLKFRFLVDHILLEFLFFFFLQHGHSFSNSNYHLTNVLIQKIILRLEFWSFVHVSLTSLDVDQSRTQNLKRD